MPVYPPYRRIHNRIKHQSDAICQRFGLEVLTPYQKPKQKSINQREYRTALRGDSKKLKLTNAIRLCGNNNPIEQITEETVAALTEPIQPQYLLLTLEQYNKIAEYFSTVGNSIVRNTDLISELPTHQDLNDLITQTLRPCLTEMRKAATDKMDSIEYSTKDKLSWQFIFQKVQ